MLDAASLASQGIPQSWLNVRKLVLHSCDHEATNCHDTKPRNSADLNRATTARFPRVLVGSEVGARLGKIFRRVGFPATRAL